MIRGTCKYIYHNVLSIRNDKAIVELFPKNCKFSYTKGFLYRISFDGGTLYLDEKDFHRYFKIIALKKDDEA